MKQRIFITFFAVLLLVQMVFAYTPTPAPVLPPSDPNKPNVIGSITKVTSTFPITLSFDVDIVTVDGMQPTMTSTTLMFNTPTITSIAADPNGLAKIFTYRMSRQITAQGLYYSSYMAKNQYNQTETQNLEYRVVRSSAPVTTGCRAVNQ
jgi:hypothetical protein